LYEWQKQIQIFIDEIDKCIKNYNDEALTLQSLSRRLGYSEFYTTRKFRYAVQRLSSAQKIGLCAERGAGQ